MITIGAIILNYKTFDDTIRVVLDLLKMEAEWKLRIIIVDNLSPNESFQVLTDKFSEYSNVDVIQSGNNGGYAKGNNVGLRFLQKYDPDYAMILNNDVYFEKDLIDNCIYWIEKINCTGAISGIQKNIRGEIANFSSLSCPTFLDNVLSFSILYSKFKRKHKYCSNTKWENIQKVDIVLGSLFLIKYKVFKEVGFFDESTFLFYEEKMLYKKLANAGYSNYLILDQSYVHAHSKTINSEVNLWNKRKMALDGAIAFTKKYRNFPTLKIWILKGLLYLTRPKFALYHMYLKKFRVQ